MYISVDGSEQLGVDRKAEGGIKIEERKRKSENNKAVYESAQQRGDKERDV